MQIVFVILFAWLLHAGIASSVTPLVYSGQKRVRWYRFELLALAIPFLVWLDFVVFVGLRQKGYTNVLVEPAIFGLAIPIAALIRVAIGTRISELICFTSLIVAVSFVAVGVYFTVPFLP